MTSDPCSALAGPSMDTEDLFAKTVPVLRQNQIKAQPISKAILFIEFTSWMFSFYCIKISDLWK